MSHVHRRIGLSWTAVLLLVGIPGLVAAEEGYVGSETCAACHDEVASAFARTTHGLAPHWDEEMGCEGCHGPGQAHVDGDLEAIVKPQELPPAEASATCLSCHDRHEALFGSATSPHRLSDITCIDCHSPHSTAEQQLPVRGVQLCGDCHQAVVAQFDMPRSHPLPATGPACETCHDPHTGNTLPSSRGFGNPVCTDCHFEKSGPFVYAHDVALVDDCSSCHQVHGSTNRHLLTHARQVNLCYECHAGTTTPGFHNAGNFVNEKCTACHTAIHGSNTNPFFLEE